MRKPVVEGEEEKEVEIDTETTNVVMHKDSVWNKQWENIKNSPVGESGLNLYIDMFAFQLFQFYNNFY